MTNKRHAARTPAGSGPFGDALDDIVAEAEAGAADELASGDGLDGECWVSTLLGLLESASSVDELPDVASVFRGGIVARVATQPAPATAGLLRLFDEVAPAPGAAAPVVASSGAELPRWGDPGPVVPPTAAYLMTDEFGDQDGLTLVYAETPQRRAHVIGALVDHNLGGSLRDVFVNDDVDDCVDELHQLDGEYYRVIQIDGSDALERLGRALAVSRFQPGGASASGSDVAALAAMLRRRVGGTDIRPIAPTDAELTAAAGAVLAAAGIAERTPTWTAGAELLRAWGRHSGLPLRPSPLALTLALFDGIATRRWREEELAALGLAMARIVELGFADRPDGSPRSDDERDDQADELQDVLDDLWPHAQQLLRRGERLAPTRREVLDALVADDDEDGDEDDDGWDDDEPWDDDSIDDLAPGVPVIDLGRRRPSW